LYDALVEAAKKRTAIADVELGEDGKTVNERDSVNPAPPSNSYGGSVIVVEDDAV
jgi:hypothetical protein